MYSVCTEGTYVSVDSMLLEFLGPEVAFQVCVCMRAYVCICLRNAYVKVTKFQKQELATTALGVWLSPPTNIVFM